MAGLFGGKMAPGSKAMEPDEDDYSDDLDLGMSDEDADDADSPPGAGPFDSYAATVLDPDASPEERTDALRQAILTLIEEQGGGGMPPMPGGMKP